MSRWRCHIDVIEEKNDSFFFFETFWFCQSILYHHSFHTHLILLRSFFDIGTLSTSQKILAEKGVTLVLNLIPPFLLVLDVECKAHPPMKYSRVGLKVSPGSHPQYPFYS